MMILFGSCDQSFDCCDFSIAAGGNIPGISADIDVRVDAGVGCRYGWELADEREIDLDL